MNRNDCIDYLDSNATEKELEILVEMVSALRHAERLHKVWPGDMIHRVAIVNEEAGELVKAVLDRSEDKCVSMNDIFTECMHTGAMCLRFAKNMEEW